VIKDLHQAVGTELEGHDKAAGLIGHYLTHEAPPPPPSDPSAETNHSQTPSNTERLVENARCVPVWTP
jgi:hypothetical protein